jgi:hypothetical protein
MGIKNRCFEDTDKCPFCGRSDKMSPEDLMIEIEGLLMTNHDFETRRLKAEMIKALVYSDTDRFEQLLKLYQSAVPV